MFYTGVPLTAQFNILIITVNNVHHYEKKKHMELRCYRKINANLLVLMAMLLYNNFTDVISHLVCDKGVESDVCSFPHQLPHIVPVRLLNEVVQTLTQQAIHADCIQHTH